MYLKILFMVCMSVFHNYQICRISKGHVKWYLPKDIRTYKSLIKESSPALCIWLEDLFS